MGYFLISCLSRYLDETVLFLLAALKSNKEKACAFQAIGLLAISVGHNIQKHMPGIMELVRLSLPPKETQTKYVYHRNTNCVYWCQILPLTNVIIIYFLVLIQKFDHL